MNIELFEHNEIAYQKLENFLETEQMGSIDHATGTGKSFIALKYLFNHKNQNILYLTPTYYIFTQLTDVHMPKLGINKTDFEKIDNIIYSNLLKRNIEELANKYDIFVFDEYHRCGAKLWGTKVNELLNYIKEKYPQKKVIGLTATPTRYLDNERNMNDEIFLGKSISTLTLSDAILNGLLPPPTYINTANAHIEYLESVKDKLRKKIVYEEDREKLAKILESITETIKNNLKLDLDININLPRKNGKYIVFCSKIDDIPINMQIIRERFSDRNLSFNQVHSRQTIEKNEKELNEFRFNDNTDKFVFVVDSLNEGIHVDNIDGIFLMRKTKSPIIYFQQLGRLLSYSTKQKKLMVWDMVDNIKNHNVIYNLYQDVINEAKKRIKTDKKNKKRYNQIISNFKILDNYTDIVAKIKEVEEQIDKMTEEEIFNIRISRFVEILSHQYKNDSKISRKTQINQLFKAYDDLYKYYKHINLNQFLILKKCNITLPDEINISEEDFENNLMGYNTLHEKELAYELKIFNSIKENIFKLRRIPSVISNNKKEQDYSYYIFNAINNSSKKIKKMYNDLFNNYTINDFDKCYYFNTEKNINYNLFFKLLDFCLLNDISVNKNIYKTFIKLYSNHEFYNKYNLEKYIGKLKYKYNVGNLTKTLYFETKYKEKQTVVENINLSKLKFYGLESVDESDVKLFIEKYIEELKEFVKEKRRYPNTSDKELYIKYLVFKPFIKKYEFTNIIVENLENSKKTEKELLIQEIINFMINNCGDYPSDRVLNEDEFVLFQKIKRNENVLKYYEDKLNVIQKNIRKDINDNWFIEYINFIKEKRRYPILQSDDFFEKTLIIRFLRNEDFLTKEEKKELKTILKQIGENEIIKNTFLERKKARSK